MKAEASSTCSCESSSTATSSSPPPRLVPSTTESPTPSSSPAPMAASPPWAQLPAFALHEIVRRLPCDVDRLRVDVVCRSWREALTLLPPPPPPSPLPCLLLPHADGPTFSCILSGCGTHSFYVPHGLRDVRYLGSYDGGWLFLAVNQTQGHALFHLHTYELVELPNVLRLHLGPEEQQREIVILAATLSSPPDEEGCVASGIITFRPFVPGPRHITFWRMGDQVVLGSIEPPLTPWAVEDLIFHNGAFHFLTQGERLIVCAPIFLQDGGVQAELEWRYFPPVGRSFDQHVGARYLVESRGELLMVVRCAPHPGLPTSLFRVFQMTRPQMPNGEVWYTWTELHALDGRILFVARGSSRSYEVAEYPGFEDGVYFLDDGSFYNAATMFQDVNQRQYPCSDNGNWSELPPHVERCFPEQGPSNYSPPVWFLP